MVGRRWWCDGGGDREAVVMKMGISDRGRYINTIYFTLLHSPLQFTPAITHSSFSQLPSGEHFHPPFINDDNESQTGHILLAQGHRARKLAQALCLQGFSPLRVGCQGSIRVPWVGAEAIPYSQHSRLSRPQFGEAGNIARVDDRGSSSNPSPTIDSL